ncbi:MAG: hypothetical protein K8S15_06685 [Candidatus Aegiribacteria sp.]|nr:hypothetical protein [Candidatus Aegiribacteria sp.]
MIESWSWINDQGEMIGFFRPLTSATFMLEYPLFGLNPLAYRLVNLAMHLLCAFSIARLVMLLSGKKWFAVFAAALFSVYPGTVVATGMIVARHDILACLFSVLALNSTVILSRTPKTTWKAIMPALFVLFAVSSKELGMGNFIALPIMYFLWPGREKFKKNTLIFITSLVIVAVVYLAARYMVFGNLGGYGAYTELVAVPAHVAILFLQVTGTFFVGLPISRLLVYLSIVYVIANYARGELQQWRKVGVAVLVTGAYSFQSIVGDVAEHYVYTASAFTVLFLVYFAGRIEIPSRRGKQLLAGIALLAVLAAGYVTKRECCDFNNKYTNCEIVYTALENISDSLPSESGAVCLVLSNSNTPIENEMKNVPLYMGLIDIDSQCTFLIIRELNAGSDLPILVWEQDKIVIR